MSEVDVQKREVVRLTELLESLRLELNTCKQQLEEANKRLQTTDTSTYTTRVSELEEIVSRQRKELASNDELITRLRTELREASEHAVSSAAVSTSMPFALHTDKYSQNVQYLCGRVYILQ